MLTKRIKIDDLDETMVVAEEVADPTGEVLLCSGESIQAKHLEILRSRGVSEVLIEFDTGDADDTETSAADFSEILARRFALNDCSQSPIPALIKICEQDSASGCIN
jgi:hypothetical protein